MSKKDKECSVETVNVTTDDERARIDEAVVDFGAAVAKLLGTMQSTVGAVCSPWTLVGIALESYYTFCFDRLQAWADDPAHSCPSSVEAMREVFLPFVNLAIHIGEDEPRELGRKIYQAGYAALSSPCIIPPARRTRKKFDA